PLRWAATALAEARQLGEVRACAAALTTIAADSGLVDALSGLAHALGEVALLEGDAEQAASQFERALTLAAEVGAPFERAEALRGAAAALAVAGRREEAVERLVAAHRIARRLRARPLVSRLAADVSALGERLDRRLGRLAAEQQESGGLTRRELEVVRLLAV